MYLALYNAFLAFRPALKLDFYFVVKSTSRITAIVKADACVQAGAKVTLGFRFFRVFFGDNR
ncbi:hypothetical protein BTA35_0213035 [Oceanospirillum linum]|uniref:Uncharacterized protein n=1 Tax=Oceanospirillum linum TaxID=966 RepID=A0A1T1H9B4_OCELI|nr:hypothetical protein BTA35_0213035 [Oceanospirillum linum]